MALKQIDAGTAFKRVRDGKPIYILQPISKRTTIEDMMDAVAFAEVIQEEPEADLPKDMEDVNHNLAVKVARTAEKQNEPKAEEVAEQTEAPATKRKRGIPASLDKGKVMSLYRAGWALEAIANEMDAPIAKIRAVTMAEDL